MSEDIRHRMNRITPQRNDPSSQLLIELDNLLRNAEYCLSYFNLPLPDDLESTSTENRLLLDELNYDIPTMESMVVDDIPRLNNNKKKYLMLFIIL